MHNSRFHLPCSILSLCTGIVATLAVVYIGLIAVVMTYAALTVEFSQSVKNDEASVAILDSQYLAGVARIQSTNVVAAGYVKPVALLFVPATRMTALR